ncbi:MAG: hypothetical protein JWO02_1601 [Solirubrobacterales bacterium]|nr:hypothetical protein [Solirubrobacterales bacterium]
MKDGPDPVPADGVIQIALRLHGSMPAGVATGPGGAARDFTGWMGLMSAVDALAAAGKAATEDEQP